MTLEMLLYGAGWQAVEPAGSARTWAALKVVRSLRGRSTTGVASAGAAEANRGRLTSGAIAPTLPAPAESQRALYPCCIRFSSRRG